MIFRGSEGGGTGLYYKRLYEEVSSFINQCGQLVEQVAGCCRRALFNLICHRPQASGKHYTFDSVFCRFGFSPEYCANGTEIQPSVNFKPCVNVFGSASLVDL